MTRRRWGRAGVALSADEVQRRARKLRADAARSAAYRAESLADGRRAWERGALRPWMITMALNVRGLEGPEVDVACLAQEPDVDDWEAGWRYPSWPQFLALCELTGFGPGWFAIDHRPPPSTLETSLRFHLPLEHLRSDPLVLRFSPAAIREQIPDYLPERPASL